MLVPIMLLLVALGTVVFHFASPWWFTPIPANWIVIDTTMDLNGLGTGVVFAGLIRVIAWCTSRYRYHEGKRPTTNPKTPSWNGG